MKITIPELMDMKLRLASIAAEVLQHPNLPIIIEENFFTTIKVGFLLIEELKNGYRKNSHLPNVISISHISQVQDFLIKCEYSIGFAGIEIKDSFCDLQEDLEMFNNRRLYLMRYLQKNILN